MSLFIRNMNMPRINRLYKCELDVRPSGTVLKVNNPITGKEERYVVQEIATPHGRLIDADKLVWFIDNHIASGKKWVEFETIKDMINSLPTIIEAEIAYE